MSAPKVRKYKVKGEWVDEPFITLGHAEMVLYSDYAALEAQWKAQIDENRKLQARLVEDREVARLTDINRELVSTHNTHVIMSARDADRIAALEQQVQTLREALVQIQDEHIATGELSPETIEAARVALAATEEP